MLTMSPRYNLKNAKEYFEQHLQRGDCHIEGQRVMGQWFGKGAEQLGLSGVIQANEFLSLCENRHPQTGKRLTQRQNTTRLEVGKDGVGHKRLNRRIFYDFTLSPPKSVSVVAFAGNDPRIIEAHDKAVHPVLKELQTYAATRVQRQKQNLRRITGNFVGAIFRHDTSRALDPHLHSHCILFNATQDTVENRWKALELYQIFCAQKFAENLYYHELAKALVGFGYLIQNRPRGDFEIEGVLQEWIDRFSKRHREIDEKTRELLARKPEKARLNLSKIRANIAHRNRRRKIKDIDPTELQLLWKKQLSLRERNRLHRLHRHSLTVSGTQFVTAKQAVKWAEERLFERRSIVHEHELWRYALEHARGQNVSLYEIQAITRERDYVRDMRFWGKVTTKETIQREWNIVCLAQDGIRRYLPFASEGFSSNELLNAEQRQAAEQILSSRDFVTLFCGGASRVKSDTLREVCSTLKHLGYMVQILAPENQQAADLQAEGCGRAQTVSAFLTRRRMPPGSVVLVDEAGRIGGGQMLQLLLFLRDNRSRVILSGDARQRGVLKATDAFRALEKHSGLQSVQWMNTLRQNVARSGGGILALDITESKESFAHRLARIWKRDLAYVLNVQHSQRSSITHQTEIIQLSETRQNMNFSRGIGT